MACRNGLSPEGAETEKPGVSETGTTHPDDGEVTSSLVAFSADARPEDGTSFISWDTDSTVPFLVEEGEAGGPSEFRLGLWDTATGSVSIEDRPLFETSVESRVFWDGSEHFVIAPYKPEYARSLQITVNDRRLRVRAPEMALRLPADRHALAAALRDGSVEAMAYGSSVIGAFLEVKSGSTYEKVELAPPIPEFTLGPVALEIKSPSEVIVHLEVGDGTVIRDGLSYTLGAVWAGTWDGESVSWQLVARGLEMNQAGGGGVVRRFRNQLAVGDAMCVTLLDLQTGEYEPASEVNDAMRSFAEDFVKDVEFSVSAGTGAYGDFLLVSWSPACIERGEDGRWTFIPTQYKAAVRNSKVVCEIKRVGNRMWVEKDGEILQEIDPPSYTRWTFPSWTSESSPGI